MRAECTAVALKTVTALISIFLLICTPLTWAGGISNAQLLSVEQLQYSAWEKRISVRIGFRIERLLVVQNTYLNDLHITKPDGTIVKQSSTAYAGIVESMPNSWARVVIDGDYVAGTIQVHGNNTHFTSENTTYLSGATMLAEPVVPPPESISQLNLRRSTRSTAFEEVSVPVNERLTQTIGDVTRVLRIGIVVDGLYQEALGGRGLSRAISTINSVDALYREKFGLALKVDVVVLVADESFLRIDESSNIDPNQRTLKDHLDLFREYRINSDLLPDDLGLVHLFSGVQSPDQAIGLAFSGAACRTDGHDVSMARPFLFPELLTAHEIGHNLGADHDDATECSQVDSNLMYSSISATTTREFSSCSTEMINTRMQQSTCFTGVLDIDLQVEQLESNQIEISVSNLDETRAFPSANLFVDLNNASVTEAPAMCELEDPAKLTCLIPATFAGDTQKLAIKLRLEPELERSVLMRVEPNGFFDLNNANNAAELIIPGEELPLASPAGEVVATPEEPETSVVSDDDIEVIESMAGEGVSDIEESIVGEGVSDIDESMVGEGVSDIDESMVGEGVSDNEESIVTAASSGGGGTPGLPFLSTLLVCSIFIRQQRLRKSLQRL